MVIKKIVKLLVQELDPQSILCYGSYAQGMHDEKSDRDLLILMEAIPSRKVREGVYRKIAVQIEGMDKKTVGEWDNSWSPVNDRLRVGSQVLEIGYNTVSWVEEVIEKLIVECAISFEAFRFRPYTFLGLLEASQVFYDKEGFVEKCKERIRPIPEGLKKKIFEANFPVLMENYEDLVDCYERKIGILAFECYLFRGLDAAIQLLFIMNDVYDPASKRTEAFLLKLKKLPAGLKAFIEEVLPRFYERQKEVCEFFQKMIQFLKEQR